MKIAQQLTDIKSLKFPVVKLKISNLEQKGMVVTPNKIQIGDNYIIKQGETILDCFTFNNPSQLETTAIYECLQEFVIDNYAHPSKQLIVDSAFRLYSLSFVVTGRIFTAKIKKKAHPYYLFHLVPYYLEAIVDNVSNYPLGLIAEVSDIYFHLGWSDKEINKRILI